MAYASLILIWYVGILHYEISFLFHDERRMAKKQQQQRAVAMAIAADINFPKEKIKGTEPSPIACQVKKINYVICGPLHSHIDFNIYIHVTMYAMKRKQKGGSPLKGTAYSKTKLTQRYV